MATCTAWKIIFNGCILPEIYYSYDIAKERLGVMEENSCGGFGRVVLYDDETNEIIG